MKILVVDDDPQILEALAVGFQLRWQGATVIPVADGEAGLWAFEEYRPDVVVLDIALPGQDGFQLLQEIRRLSDVPVIVLTARGDEGDRTRGLGLGANDYLVKPFSHPALLARIEAVLRQRAAGDHLSHRGDMERKERLGMKCTNCGRETTRDAYFCGSCGAPLSALRYCTRCGAQAPAGASFCGQCGARLEAPTVAATQPIPLSEAGDREALLRAIEQKLSQYPQLQVTRGSRTDLEIRSLLADHPWSAGKKVEYSACLLVKEAERTLIYWEMIREVGAGTNGVFAGFKVETYGSDGKTMGGRVQEVGWSPGGRAIHHNWDYAQTRSLVEGVARAQGWKLTTTL